MKKILYLFIALTLVLGSVCPVANAYEKVSYTDIPGNELATEWHRIRSPRYSKKSLYGINQCQDSRLLLFSQPCPAIQ